MKASTKRLRNMFRSTKKLSSGSKEDDSEISSSEHQEESTLTPQQPAPSQQQPSLVSPPPNLEEEEDRPKTREQEREEHISMAKQRRGLRSRNPNPQALRQVSGLLVQEPSSLSMSVPGAHKRSSDVYSSEVEKLEQQKQEENPPPTTVDDPVPVITATEVVPATPSATPAACTADFDFIAQYNQNVEELVMELSRQEFQWNNHGSVNSIPEGTTTTTSTQDDDQDEDLLLALELSREQALLEGSTTEWDDADAAPAARGSCPSVVSSDNISAITMSSTTSSNHQANNNISTPNNSQSLRIPSVATITEHESEISVATNLTEELTATRAALATTEERLQALMGENSQLKSVAEKQAQMEAELSDLKSLLKSITLKQAAASTGDAQQADDDDDMPPQAVPPIRKARRHEDDGESDQGLKPSRPPR